MFNVQGVGIDRARGLYSEVQCIMGNGDMGAREQTDMAENITFPRHFVGKQ